MGFDNLLIIFYNLDLERNPERKKRRKKEFHKIGNAMFFYRFFSFLLRKIKLSAIFLHVSLTGFWILISFLI